MSEYHYKNLGKEETAKKGSGQCGAGLATAEMNCSLGSGKHGRESMMYLPLKEHVAKFWARDALILQQARKAREVRAFARK